MYRCRRGAGWGAEGRVEAAGGLGLLPGRRRSPGPRPGGSAGCRRSWPWPGRSERCAVETRRRRRRRRYTTVRRYRRARRATFMTSTENKYELLEIEVIQTEALKQSCNEEIRKWIDN